MSTRDESSLLTKLLNREGIRDSRQRRAAAAHLGQLRRYPGDLKPLGEPYITGMAVAMATTSPTPGWIPVVQADAMRLGEIAESLVQNAARATKRA